MKVSEALASVEFIVGRDGKPRAAVLDMAAWEALIDWLEDMEDLGIVQAALPRLRMGPEKAGMLRWEDVEAEWDDEFHAVDDPRHAPAG
jgi:predicted DNA-binding protein